MFLICSSCNSRYIVNSANLKPNGRTVRCATCQYEWFQEPIQAEQVVFESSTPSGLEDEDNKLKRGKNYTSNLPSTYIEKEKTSLTNSVIVVLILILVFISNSLSFCSKIIS